MWSLYGDASLPAQFTNTVLTDQTSDNSYYNRFFSSVWWIKMNTENLRHQISSSYWARVDLHLIAWARNSVMFSLVPPNCVLLGFLLKTASLQHSTFNLLQHKHFCLRFSENVILKYLLPLWAETSWRQSLDSPSFYQIYILVNKQHHSCHHKAVKFMKKMSTIRLCNIAFLVF